MTTFREVLKSARPRDAMALAATDGDSRRSRALDESLYRELARAHAPMEMPLPFYSFFVDDLGMAANFDPIHELGRLRNAFLSHSIKMYSVHLSAEALLSVAHHVGITIGDHLLAPDNKQKFKTTGCLPGFSPHAVCMGTLTAGKRPGWGATTRCVAGSTRGPLCP